MEHVNDKDPNFYGDDGRFFLVRCFACGGDRGRENWSCAVATGCCAFCGWTPADTPPGSEESAKRKRDDGLRQVFG